MNAIRTLGIMLFKGEGGDENMKEGISFLEKAAANGDEAARANLDALRGVPLLNF